MRLELQNQTRNHCFEIQRFEKFFFRQQNIKLVKELLIFMVEFGEDLVGHLRLVDEITT